jgi:hypothetical protein
MRAIAEPVARKKRKGARGLFANSPLNFLDLGDPTQIIELIRKGLPAQAIDFVADLLSLSRASLHRSRSLRAPWNVGCGPEKHSPPRRVIA